MSQLDLSSLWEVTGETYWGARYSKFKKQALIFVKFRHKRIMEMASAFYEFRQHHHTVDLTLPIIFPKLLFILVRTILLV